LQLNDDFDVYAAGILWMPGSISFPRSGHQIRQGSWRTTVTMSSA